MKHEYVEFVKILLDSIDASQKLLECTEKQELEKCNALLSQKQDIVKIKYKLIDEKGLSEGLFEFLKKEYGGDDVYIVLLDYIYSVVQDLKLRILIMEEELGKEIENNADIHLLINYDMQIGGIAWANHINRDFKRCYEINGILSDRLNKRIGFSCERIPVEERNKNTVVVMTSQMLGINHAPTKLALKTCYRIKKILNKEVVIINLAQYTDVDKLRQIGIQEARYYNYIEKYNGAYGYEYEDMVFPMYQALLKDGNENEIKEVLEYIYSLKPICIMNIGTLPAILGLTNQITTSVYIGCTQGYAPVFVDYFFNYFPSFSERASNNKKILEERSVKIIDHMFIGEREEIKYTISRNEFDIPEDAFVLGVAGNRLEIDCDENYLKQLDSVMNSKPQVYVLVIGKVSDEFLNNRLKGINNASRFRFIGYRQDFLECMAIIDLYVNSFGVGGGTAGNNALYLGKPIVTLKAGDIYAFAGEEFGVNGVSEYASTILKYIDDKEYYEEQSKAAKNRYNALAASDEKYALALNEVIERIGETV